MRILLNLGAIPYPPFLLYPVCRLRYNYQHEIIILKHRTGTVIPVILISFRGRGKLSEVVIRLSHKLLIWTLLIFPAQHDSGLNFPRGVIGQKTRRIILRNSALSFLLSVPPNNEASPSRLYLVPSPFIFLRVRSTCGCATSWFRIHSS